MADGDGNADADGVDVDDDSSADTKSTGDTYPLCGGKNVALLLGESHRPWYTRVVVFGVLSSDRYRTARRRRSLKFYQARQIQTSFTTRLLLLSSTWPPSSSSSTKTFRAQARYVPRYIYIYNTIPTLYTTSKHYWRISRETPSLPFVCKSAENGRITIESRVCVG